MTISCEIVFHGLTENIKLIEIFLKIILNLILLNYSFYSAGLIDQIIHLSAQKKLKTGVPGLLYDANTRTALAFPRDSDYTKARMFELAGDHLSIWQRGKEMIGNV